MATPASAARGAGWRLERLGPDEVLEDGHEEEDGDEDGRGREAEGDGVHGRAEVPQSRRLAPRVGRRRWLHEPSRAITASLSREESLLCNINELPEQCLRPS